MQFSRNKTMATLIALFLVLTITATLVLLPVANAHYNPTWTLVTHCYVATVPPLVGINQQMLFIFWINWIPPGASGQYGDRWKFTLTVTKPDGTTETLGPFTSDPVGGSWTTYVPTQLGEYSVVAHFPATVLTGYPTRGNVVPTNANVNDTFAASDSAPVDFTVQQAQDPLYVETPLPTGYWTRPIYGTNRFWYEIAADWLGGSAQNMNATTRFAYGAGPESAHVLWTRSYWAGGVSDAKFPAISTYSGQSYESYGSPITIIDGKLWYPVEQPPREGYYCVDLYTGETIYFRNTTGSAPVGSAIGAGGFDSSGDIPYGVPAFGQMLDIEDPNQHGTFPYFWVTTTGVTNQWDLYDAFTGNYICSVANASSTGTAFTDAIGSICYINFVNLGTAAAPNYRMQIWNTTEAIWWKPWYGAQGAKTALNGSHTSDYTPPAGVGGGATANAYWMWRPYLNYTFDGRGGYSMNVSVSNIAGPVNAVLNQTGSIRAVRTDQYVIVGTDGRNDARGVVNGYLRAYSLKPGNWGNVLWDITFTPPAAIDAYPNATYSSLGNPTLSTVDPEDGVFIFTDRITNKWWAYSLTTGQLLWTSTPEGQFNYYGISQNIYKGKLLTYGYMGQLIAYNITTGNILWNWTAPSYGLGETYFPYTPLSLGAICDGKIYLYTSEHSVNQPIRRDAHVWCVDLTTGKLIWALPCWPSGAPIIADGRLVVMDCFSQQMYCLGKGPSATTVSAPQTVPSLGSSVTITGTVTDQSPSGKQNAAGSLDFALKGTPAISDADMDAWMEYLFQQRPMPSNAKGVEVTLDAIDPNNNFIHIGTTTSDLTGAYGFVWQPEVPGTYQIIATFAGSKSYGSSFAQTYMGVGEAPTTPTTTEQIVQLPPFDLYIIGATIAIIIAVAIVGMLILRKHP